MSKYKVDICRIQTSQLKVLSSEEMTELLQAYHNDPNEFLKEKMVMGNLKLVLSLVQRFSLRQENMDDLFQVGCVGLVKAIDNFNVDLQVQFSTYAVPLILGEMKRYLRETSLLKVSRYLRDLAYHAGKLKEEYLKSHQEEPSHAYLAEQLQVPLSDLEEALNSQQGLSSLSDPINGKDGDQLTLADQIADQMSDPAYMQNRIALKVAINQLDPRERYLVLQRYYEGKTQLELAEELFVSQAQISRLEKAALSHLRHYL